MLAIVLLLLASRGVFNLPLNDTATLLSKYAKVTRWGADSQNSDPSHGRSAGQSLWTHRSDVNVIAGQSLKTKTPTVTYQYPVNKKQEVKSGSQGIGEVIEDRFNPKPFFTYGQIPPKSSGSSKPAYPVYNPPPSSAPAPSKPPVDLYTSPYTSYNPPDAKPSGNSDSSGYQYNPPLPAPPSSAETKPDDSKQSSLGPPLSIDYVNNHHDTYESDPEPSHEDHDHDTMSKDNGPPDYPPKSEDDVYYPPDDHETIMDHPPADHKPDMAENDLSPPPSDDADAKFPHYLYDHPYDDHHHVYEEIHPATPETEHQRVNKGQYSYYYLGRKLWYVPLYFSIYFIIYVAVLILKSIARHKIEFKHNYFDGKTRKAKTMDLEDINNLHVNVTNGIESARKRYDKLAM